MTAPGTLLLLLGLCVCSTTGLQHSAPRVRLAFKGKPLTHVAHLSAGIVLTAQCGSIVILLVSVFCCS